MRLPRFIPNAEKPDDVISRRLQQILRAFDKNIEFGSPATGALNIRGSWVSVQSPAVADTEFTVTHNLGSVPQGYDVKILDQAAVVYASRQSSWTETQMYLKCNVASTNLTLFVH